MRVAMVAFVLLSPVVAYAQAPAAGSGGGGGVGASVAAPAAPSGQAPPGTPSGQTSGGEATRDAASKGVIGPTTTSPSPVPGNTGGADSGVRR